MPSVEAERMVLWAAFALVVVFTLYLAWRGKGLQ